MRLSKVFFSVLLIYVLSYQYVSANFEDYPVHSDKWTSEYDRHFKKYSKRYFGPLFDWHWFKAQAIAESGLANDAKSHMGALGLMQIMPQTFEEISRQNPHFDEPDSPKWNIAAGIYYDRQIYRKIKNANEEDKLYMTFASYNAGYGRILDASKIYDSKNKNWEEIKVHLPKETRGYVDRIRKLMGDL